MKIKVGTSFARRPNITLIIPGIGHIISKPDTDNRPFDMIVLDKDQLKQLKQEIERELNE
jgi:hypothetical protein